MPVDRLVVGSCESIPLDWNPFAPDSPLAAPAITLAGFVLAGLAGVAVDRRRPHRSEIAALLGSALACLVVAGFVGSVISREPSCLFGWAENMFATALMSVGAVCVCCALAWLLYAYLGPQPPLMAAARWCAYGMVMLVTIFQAFNAQRFLLDTIGGSVASSWSGWFVVVDAPLTLASLVLVRACWLARPIRLAGYPPRRLRRPARLAALATSVLALIGLVVTAVVAGQPGSDGVVVPTWVVHFAVTVPMLLAAVAILVLAYALPHPLSSDAEPAPQPPPVPRPGSGQAAEPDAAVRRP